ncbi:Pc24g01530 [Penicillium rubens Wisconsin 54-1255]|uniref:Pc24g01530 protein n=1 Tax=Penicillium rubens (strain ATCC 28089 / DSM 1075 / NRRL 1951 / Wisconsin 54-1255) TaxID=500485 RepID=B6HWU4_PENRW|nr:Pc24g01530 [Penicillium rubens Wisconsin 54-1255]
MILNEDLLNDRPRMMKDAVGLIFVPKKGMGELQAPGRLHEHDKVTASVVTQCVKVRDIASKGGHASGGSFQPGDPRAKEAGRKGGHSSGQPEE